MYRHWVKPKLPLQYVIAFLLTCAAGLYVGEKTKVQTKYISFDRQVEAAHIMRESMREIKAYRETKNIPINREFDVNETGIIGEAVTALTTTVGDIEAKRTATNPACAALMVRLFSEAGLKSGDVVAIGASGSFPSLILATLSAANVMQLRPLLIYSLGSSMYGANNPEFTFIDMLSVLNNKGLLPYKAIAVSLGGDNDRAGGLLHEDQGAIFLRVAQMTELPLIYEDDIAENIQKRIQLYEKAATGHPIRCFVNIGGATANYGNTPASLNFPNGLVSGKTSLTFDSGEGLIFTYVKRNIPVIHLLNIRELAKKYGLPIDPVPFPEIGSEGVYYTIVYRKGFILFFLTIAITLLYIGGLHHRMRMHRARLNQVKRR